MKHLSILLAVLMVTSLASAQGAAGGKTEVRVVAVSVGKKIPEDKENKLSPFLTGVKLTLLIRRSDGFFIGMDKKTKLLSFTDDRKTDLLKKTKKWGMSGISEFPKFSADGHMCVVDINGTTPPAKGAKAILVKAKFVMKCGEGEKTATQKNMKLAKGSKLTVGPVPWTIEKVGKPQWGDAKMAITVTGNVAHDAIKKLVFLDADGKEIKHSIGGRSRSGFGRRMGRRMTYGVTYNLKKKVDTVTVKITYFEKLETITIPIDLTVGVGL